MRSKAWISAGVVLVILVLTAAGVIFLLRTDQESTARVQEPPRRVAVEVRRLAPGPFTRVVEAYASVTPFRKGTVSAQVSGPIAKLASQTEPGMQVKGGEELARVEDTRYRLAVDKQRATLEKLNALLEIERNENQRRTALFQIAKQRLTLAQSDYDRKKELFKKDLVAAQTLEIAESQVELQKSEFERAKSELQNRQAHIQSIEADIASAKAELDRLLKDLADTAIRAPFDGIIGDRYVELGDRVAVGEKLFTVLDMTSVKVVARVPSEHIDLIRPGRRVEVSTRAYPGTAFEGTVIHVYPEADLRSRTFAVEVQVINRGTHELLPGMFARVRLPIMALENVLSIPREAVLEDDQGPYVYLVDKATSTARRRKVVLGYIGPEEALVSDGLKAQELLVVRGQERLSDGATVLWDGSDNSAPMGDGSVSPGE